MSFIRIRQLLFLVHMWIGLVLGILAALLGLSGSAIVYDQEIADFLDPPPHAVATGPVLSLDAIVDVARAIAKHDQLQIALPVIAGQPVLMRVGQISRMGPMSETGGREGRRHRHAARSEGGAAPEGGPGRSKLLFLDPVSGSVLGTRAAAMPPFLVFAHQLHGNFLMGRDGRSLVVGWLGVAMLILGATGLVLWWPRGGQWKYAFLVRRTAKGLRFHRELHAAAGIWIFAVFMAVSFSGVVLAWPQAMGMSPAGPSSPPHVEPIEGVDAIGADGALKLAEAALPDATPRSITLPAHPDQPISVAFLSHGSVPATVLVDPYRATVIARRDPSGSFLGWQRPIHQGTLHPIWRFLVFLTGFAPALFVVTGITMWVKKRRRHVTMNEPLAPQWVEGGAAK